MTKITLCCRRCGYTARRPLANTVACRGVKETSAELALCPHGHGKLVRVDGIATTAEELAEPVGFIVNQRSEGVDV